MTHSDHAVSVETTVPFHHCDPLFVVWHGRYFEYFEMARAELMKSLGLDVPDIRNLGYRMYMTDVRCRYTYPLTYGDDVRITAWLTAATPLIRVAYTVTNLTQARKSARAYTEIATTDAHGELLLQTPPVILERLPAELVGGAG
jgi:acyl-CoA thioester hydrolase